VNKTLGDIQVLQGVAISKAGGTPAPLTEIDREHGDFTHRWPQILPGGKAVLFTAPTRPGGAWNDASIKVISLGDRRKKTLLHGGTLLYKRQPESRPVSARRSSRDARKAHRTAPAASD
jgi:hypothetical protein